MRRFKKLKKLPGYYSYIERHRPAAIHGGSRMFALLAMPIKPLRAHAPELPRFALARRKVA